MNSSWIYYILIFLAGEVVATLLFLLVSKLMHKGQRDRISYRSIIKGILERLFLVVSFISGFPQALIVFGALKIATRIRDEENRISNDYFLIGNLISVLLAMAYYKIWENF